MGMIDEKEKRIAEKRAIEATKRGYLGPRGKIGLIARFMGDSIIDHTGSHGSEGFDNDINYMPDDLPGLPAEWDQSPAAIQARIPYAEEAYLGDEPIGQTWREERNYAVSTITPEIIGWHFDGLRRGLPIEIWMKTKDGSVYLTYQGRTVYEENQNILTCFVPGKEWQDAIERLQKPAKERETAFKLTENDNRRREAEALKKLFEIRLRENWGI